MAEKTEQLDGTLFAHQDPQANWWRRFEAAVRPRLVQKLARRFGNRYGVSAEDAVSSAVRVLLDPKSEDLQFESIDDLWRWLYTVAWRKLKDYFEKEHLHLRICPEELYEPSDRTMDSACDDAYQLLSVFRDSCNDEERVVLDGTMDRKTHEQIAKENDWTTTRVDTLWRRIRRKRRPHF